MTNERPLILITNDDGVWAKGINELIECLKDLGDLVVSLRWTSFRDG